MSVHKTNISPVADQNETPSTDDPVKHCPIHNKPHPLTRCRSFRLKTIEERKTYLKEQGICFKCCSSSLHLARDCKATVKCDECNSETHLTALHPGSPPWAYKNLEPPSRNDGEEEKEDNSQTLSSLCTEVCGSIHTSKSCSKICLVKVYP